LKILDHMAVTEYQINKNCPLFLEKCKK